MKKMKILIMVGVAAIICLKCSKSIETSPTGVSSNNSSMLNLSLKQSVDVSVAKVNYALNKISETQGFKILNSQSANTSMVAASFKDSITLGLIAGIYEFQTDSLQPRHMNSITRLFKKTSTSNDMIVKMPQKFIFYPGYLRNVVKKDSTLGNNFIIDASDYHYYYTNYSTFDYKLTAGFLLDSANIGSLNIAETGSNYNVKYSFNNGYYFNVVGTSGDTTQSVISLTSDTGTLIQETVTYASSGFGRLKESQYTLTIGNVEIKRTAGIDSIQVYMNGTLQNKSGVKIFDSSTNGNGSISRSRDIQITFNDGTSTTLSALLKPSYTIFNGLVSSLQSMNLATNVVDYIAVSIYENK